MVLRCGEDAFKLLLLDTQEGIDAYLYVLAKTSSVARGLPHLYIYESKRHYGILDTEAMVLMHIRKDANPSDVEACVLINLTDEYAEAIRDIDTPDCRYFSEKYQDACRKIVEVVTRLKSIASLVY